MHTSVHKWTVYPCAPACEHIVHRVLACVCFAVRTCLRGYVCPSVHRRIHLYVHIRTVCNIYRYVHIYTIHILGTLRIVCTYMYDLYTSIYAWIGIPYVCVPKHPICPYVYVSITSLRMCMPT